MEWTLEVSKSAFVYRTLETRCGVLGNVCLFSRRGGGRGIFLNLDLRISNPSSGAVGVCCPCKSVCNMMLLD